MKKTPYIAALLTLFALLLTSSIASAVEFEMSLGVHDFIVSDIVNDVAADGIDSGIKCRACSQTRH